MKVFKGINMDIIFWIIFSLIGFFAFSLLLKTNVKINKIASKKEFFPKDPQEKYFINKVKKHTKILYTLIIVTYVFLGTLVYLQHKHNQLLVDRVVTLEKTVVAKDEVIQSVAEQLGDEIANFYKEILKRREK